MLADLRRTRGDAYAVQNLRDDIVNADIFGPPGLNGTDRAIKSLREKNIVRIEAPAVPHLIAAAVIAVPQPMQAEQLDAGFTDYVPAKSTVIYRHGRREVFESTGSGELQWQLDTGHFFEHPTLGPLWYQKSGWSCLPDDTVIGKLCARVKP